MFRHETLARVPDGTVVWAAYAEHDVVNPPRLTGQWIPLTKTPGLARRVGSMDEVYASAQRGRLGPFDRVEHSTLCRIALPGTPLALSGTRRDAPKPLPTSGPHNGQSWDG